METKQEKPIEVKKEQSEIKKEQSEIKNEPVKKIILNNFPTDPADDDNVCISCQ